MTNIKDPSLFHDLFIFEVANNHEGSVEHGLKIIDEMAKIAKKYNIKAAVKFQYRDLDTFIHPDYKDRKDIKHIPRFFQNRLSDNDFLTMLRRVQQHGMLAVVTPFDEASVKKCLEHGVDIIKIASCSANDWPLLEEIARTGKPVIVSTGGLSIYEIDDVVTFFAHQHTNLAVLHCLAVYPTPNELLQMDFMAKMIKRYPALPIGYSGHEDPTNTDVVKIAVSKGAKILERHVGLPTKTIKLNAYSMNPEQTDEWVKAATIVKTISGNRAEKYIPEEEVESLTSLKRGVFAARPIKKGETITREDVFFAMPMEAKGQLTSGEFGRYRANYRASRNYSPNQAVFEKPYTDAISTMRAVIHDAKGMLHEAGVQLGDGSQIELSHHHGMKNIRNFGAVIVNVINREYCKKLIAMLPGQVHPSHRHHKKEETFHLLWGDLEVNLDGQMLQLRPGDQLLVERGTWHSFTTRNGAVLEEISTTHERGDSEYDDPVIRKLDPLERKTILESW